MKILPKIYRGLFFLACFSFVSWQSYLSFEKFLHRPRSTSIDIDDTKNWPIPQFFFCPKLKYEPLEKCNVSFEEYFRDGNWLGNCTDPKSLLEDIVVRPIEFIFWTAISTFDGEVVTPSNDDDSFWKPTDFSHDKYDDEGYVVEICYALVIPESLQKQGIRKIVTITSEATLKISPPGYLYQNHDIKQNELVRNTQLDISMDYQINNFLKIGDEDCIPDPLFKRDDCVFKQLLNQSMELFGCVPPSLGNYGIPICANSSLYSMPELDMMIDCPASCTVFKMQQRITSYVNHDQIASLSIRFPEKTTISTDQYSYTWLNLVAEVGGYVGLFLGYSVYQMTDLVDIFLQKICVDYEFCDSQNDV